MPRSSIHLRARELVLVLFLVPCVNASRVTGRVHVVGDKGRDKELFVPRAGLLRHAARLAAHAGPATHSPEPARTGLVAVTFPGSQALAEGLQMMAPSDDRIELETSGKGDDTITVLNQITDIVLDMSLHEDGFFWPYAQVAVDDGGCRLHCLGRDKADSREVMVDAGIEEEDIDYFYDMFDDDAASEPRGKVCALVVSGHNINRLQPATLKKFALVITVGEVSGDDVDESRGMHSQADIAVLNLSELRALTICSYASLTKRS